MTRNPQIRRLASRAAANLVAVAAISAIFGLKAYIDLYAAGHAAARPGAEVAIAAALRSGSEHR
jgi:hypothetical protein